MVASCQEQSITVGDNTFSVSKDRVALVVVIFDLLCSFVLYFNLLALKKHQSIVKHDINEQTLMANDFSVQMKQQPHKEHIDDLIPIYWSWAEYILDHEQQRYDPTTTQEDLNKVNLSAVNLGLNNYGYLQHYKKMAKLLKQKKYYDSKVRSSESESKTKILKQRIDALQKDSKGILEQIEAYKKKNTPEAIYVYLQF